MIRKVVVPAAGLGTRLLPATKEMPKEMLPIFTVGSGGNICLKPTLQAVFEQLFEAGFREFCFIVGRGKRAIGDHFASDNGFVKALRKDNKRELAEELEDFYGKVDTSSIVFVNQPEPKGFGDAVLRAEPFIKEDFLVHAGDTFVISPGHRYLTNLIKVHENSGASASFIVRKVENPRQYGVMEGNLGKDGVYTVKKVTEKPDKPSTNLAILPIYIFNPVIFKSLEVIKPGQSGEIQLTDGIQKLIDWGLKVVAIELEPNEVSLDIGNPESCWDAISLSYKYFHNGKK